MLCLSVLVLVFFLPFSAAQSGVFDLECNILRTLDELQNRLSSAESHISQQNSELAQVKEALASSETEVQTVKAALASSENEVQTVKAALASSENEVQTVKKALANAETNIAGLRNSLTELVATTYIRWGRIGCPGNGSELVYASYAGGSDFNSTGAADDYLCLPTDPDFAHYEDKVQLGGHVYGAEYRMGFYQNRDQGMAFFPGVDQSVDLTFQDVPCAVCRTVRSTVLMAPAKTNCHNGWTLEYKGYLSSGHSNHPAASQYVCLDDQPENIPGGSPRYENSKRFLLVEGRCGALKCPPYVDGRELTCVVCSV